MFAGIIFVNNDLTTNVQNALVRQLFITEVVSGSEFDERVALTPDYPLIIKQNNIRLLVVRSFYEQTNRNLADIVIFCKAGQAAVECNKFGPPGLSLPIDRLTWDELMRGSTLSLFDGYCCSCSSSCCSCNPNIQNNILYPLDCKVCPPIAFPFGETCNNELVPLPNPFNLPIFVRCKD